MVNNNYDLIEIFIKSFGALDFVMTLNILRLLLLLNSGFQILNFLFSIFYFILPSFYWVRIVNSLLDD